MADSNAVVSVKKKNRSKNFDGATLAFLCDEIDKHSDIINSKQTNTATNRKQTETWQKIADAVNSRGGLNRTINQLKEKYRKAVSKTKLQANLQNKDLFATGGGMKMKEMDPVYQKILEINSTSPSFSGISNGLDLGVRVVEDEIIIDTDVFLRNGVCEPELETSSHSSSMNKEGKSSETFTEYHDLVRDESDTSMKAEKNNRRNKPTTNLRQLQIETLTAEKRKAVVEIEKIKEDTKKIRMEVEKLKEERDLFKIQKEYYQLKLKQLKNAMHEQ